MKTIINSLILCFLWTGTMAQVPQAFKYQAVVRDNSGNVLPNRSVSFRISILSGSTSGVLVYSETHTGKITNSFGLVDLEIGKGNVTSGSFTNINWGNNTCFLKVEIDPNGGTAFQALGTSQLLSVPYALYSKVAESVTGGNTPSGPAGGDLTGNYPNPFIADGKVTSAKILDGTILNSDLADNAVNNAKIVNTAVSTDKLANNAVTAPKLASMGASLNHVLKWNGSAWAPSPDNEGGITLPYNGTATSNTALFGVTNLGTGGSMYAQSAGTYGLWGESTSSSGIGVYGVNKTSTGTTYGVKGEVWSPTGYSGYFTGGKVYVNGNVGIGTNTPTYRLTIYDNTFSYIHFLNSSTGIDNSRGFVIGTTPSGNPAWIWNNEPTNIHFGTNNATRMVIAGDGHIEMNNLLNIGVSGSSALKVSNAQAIWYNGDYFSWGYDANWNYFADKIYIGPIPTNPGDNYLVVNGAAAKPGGGSWSNWSDARLKDIHGNYLKGLEDILKLQPVTFSYNKGNPLHLPYDKDYTGLIAQEVQKVFPEAISQGKDGYLQFDMHPVNVAMINAFRELKTENDSLKTDNRELQTRIESLESRLSRLEKTMETFTSK